jgi:putative peptidoglycan lipid II flippase
VGDFIFAMTEQKSTQSARYNSGVVRSAAGLVALSALSPATGLAVEIVLAWRLGASSTLDAFRIASMLLTFSWGLFIVEMMPNVVVPIFAQCRARGSEEDGWTAAFSIANAFLVPTAIACTLIVIWPYWVVGLFGPGLVGGAKIQCAKFIRFFAIAALPLVWSGAAGSILYARNIVWPPSLASICGNCVILTALLLLPTAIAPLGLSLATLAASACTLFLFFGLLMPFMRGTQLTSAVWRRLDISHTVFRRAIGSCMPLIVMLLLNFVATVAVNRALSRLAPGSVAVFGYAWKMTALASLAPIALATVLFPKFAEVRAASTREAFRAICTKGIRMGLYIALPIAAACILLRLPLTLILFRRGAFSNYAALRTARCFGLLLLFSTAIVIYMYLQRISYAVHDTLAPSLVQSAVYVLQILFVPLAGIRFGADGICVLLFATQLAGCFCLTYYLSRARGAIDLAEMGAFGILLVAPMGASIWAGLRAIKFFLSSASILGLSQLVSRVSLSLGVMAVVFVALTLLLRLPEALTWPRQLRTTGTSIARLALSPIRQ